MGYPVFYRTMTERHKLVSFWVAVDILCMRDCSLFMGRVFQDGLNYLGHLFLVNSFNYGIKKLTKIARNGNFLAFRTKLRINNVRQQNFLRGQARIWKTYIIQVPKAQHNLILYSLWVNPRSKRHHIDIMCVDPTSIGRRIDAHDVNMMSFWC